MNTQVWTNARNGHHVAVTGQRIELNGKPVDELPDWVGGAPDFVFGPVQPWHGGDCPVDANAFVRCIFRGRNPYIGPAIYGETPQMKDRFAAAMWRHAPAPMRSNPAMDIIGYQVEVRQ